MNKLHLIVGVGETGSSLLKIIKEEREVIEYDTASKREIDGSSDVYIMHICFPFTNMFLEDVVKYANIYSPKFIVIHSTVPVGTTESLGHMLGELPVFNSPIRGKHPNLVEEIKDKYVKYISFNETDVMSAKIVNKEFNDIGIRTKLVAGTAKTELGKLLSLARYGVYIAFAKEQESICEAFGVPYIDVVTEFEITRNDGVDKNFKQPVLFPFKGYTGGHCVTEMMSLLGLQVNSKFNLNTPLLNKSLAINRGTVIWSHCNIYPTASIGKGVSIGTGTEIGNLVTIGNNVRIGAHCFMPEGVTIEDEVFIAPKVTFSNDPHPPSKNKKKWGKVLVKKGAAIGMGSIILPNITIGENAVIGAGSVVTKDVPRETVWYGVAASQHGKKEEVYEDGQE